MTCRAGSRKHTLSTVPEMPQGGYPFEIGSARKLVTALVLHRRALLLRGRVRVMIRDRATPLNLSDPRPFDRALRAHMQAVLDRREYCSCSG